MPSGSATAGPGVASAITPARPRAAGRRPPRRGHGSRAARDSVGWGLVAAAAPLPPTIWDPKNPHDLIKTRSHSGYTVSVNDRIAAAAAAFRMHSWRPETRTLHMERRGRRRTRSRAFALLLSAAGTDRPPVSVAVAPG